MRTFDPAPLWRSTVGFDRLFNLLDESARLAGNDHYPPCNIERTGEEQYQISLAIAGFSAADVSITAEQNMLTVEGKKAEKDNHQYLYQGISARPFKRVFNLADHVEGGAIGAIRGVDGFVLDFRLTDFVVGVFNIEIDVDGPLAEQVVDVLQLIQQLLLAEVRFLQAPGLVRLRFHLQGHAKLFVLVGSAGREFFGVGRKTHVLAGHGRKRDRGQQATDHDNEDEST